MPTISRNNEKEVEVHVVIPWPNIEVSTSAAKAYAVEGVEAKIFEIISVDILTKHGVKCTD